eukprot:g5654.t1
MMFPALRVPLRFYCLPHASGKEAIAHAIDPSFKEWANVKGILYPKLEVKIFENGIRGMGATEALSRDELVVQLPRKAVLEVDATTQPPRNCPEYVWKSQPWFVKLALRLLDEKAKGLESDFSGYISNLPSNIDLPLFWTEEELSFVEYPSLIRSVQQQKKEWEALFQNLSNEASNLILSKNEFMKSLAFVRSRSFSGPYIGSKLPNRVFLVFVILILAAVNIGISGLESLDKTLNAVIAVFVFNFLYELFLSQKLKVYLLAPAVDFMNHSCTVDYDLSYDYFTDGYSVRIDRDYSKGQQVFISYGKKSNDDLFQYFGFIEKGNPYDFVIVEQGMKKMHKSFRDVTSCDVDGINNNTPITIYRDGGLSSDVFEEINRWVKEQKGVDQSTVYDILITFCQTEVKRYQESRDKLNLISNLERQKMIDDFISEKISILEDYIKAVQQQNTEHYS